MTNSFDSLQQDVNTYYTEKVLTFGTVPKGVDWNSLESQELRFDQLLKICEQDSSFSLNDFGCGYGYLFEYMARRNLSFHYTGFDLSEEMIKLCHARYGNFENCQFLSGSGFSEIADYTVASGILNVKLQYSTHDWKKYVLSILHQLNDLSYKGFSFNVLTSYSDPEYMRDNLYYADPCFYFDYCKRNFSRNVALLHDYNLYEFTILVRK
ncbi:MULTISPECIES: class I SAM-dependent methyltransferase [unclassified Leptolyngbya]|uniref:class I SAM-dependent methyltransferase n=1 Tax=unclassified Leptolyngbya TaxID=2650499 RepID=UPI00168485B4|nr:MULTISPECIES: class I SAM-dependent methyltransferase [unclassified Leptolyngbya]MBD1912376.1 class I SAM-dependent methyltransferase [Leptolyngbya sp. FACHB-8]MBD2157988.1 class I SAM-dependent methyltransferase [Leptolyngbya sp. FACHB-16]